MEVRYKRGAEAGERKQVLFVKKIVGVGCELYFHTLYAFSRSQRISFLRSKIHTLYIPDELVSILSRTSTAYTVDNPNPQIQAAAKQIFGLATAAKIGIKMRIVSRLWNIFRADSDGRGIRKRPDQKDRGRYRVGCIYAMIEWCGVAGEDEGVWMLDGVGGVVKGENCP